MAFVMYCNISSALTRFMMSVAMDLSNSYLTPFLDKLIVGARLLC